VSLTTFAHTTPDRAAYVDAQTGETMTFAELNDASIRLGHALRAKLNVGDHVALLLENGLSYFIAGWACRRSGLYFIPINWHLGTAEAAYIVDNGDARALIASPKMAELAESIAASNDKLELLISGGEGFGPFPALASVLAAQSGTPDEFEPAGLPLTYSSGTTGHPKGIWRPLSGASFNDEPLSSEWMLRDLFGATGEIVYYHPAPMYHTSPLLCSMGAQALGGTVIMSPRFDAEETLRIIDTFGVTLAHFVPTHLVRILQLPEDVRNKYSHATLQQVLHSAAPCPAEVKRRIIDWWGPIVSEFYASSEGGGCTVVYSDEWLAKPGTVGKTIGGAIHILDDDGREVPVGEIGHITFEDGIPFEYYKDSAKTQDFFTPEGWAKLGDMGWVDEEGFLFLADRASHMIISGGVNIYPQEIEDALILHPAIRDAAVIGVPDPDFGEAVRAVVELKDGFTPGPELEAELIAYCRSKLAKFKCPKAVDFMDELPRIPSGKLLKRELRKLYWGEGRKLIV